MSRGIGTPGAPQKLAARRTLERAQFFLDRAGKQVESDRHECQHFLEAAIVFARSVTFHLQKELGTAPWFDEWYRDVQEELKRNTIARYMLTSRNIILKEGPMPVRRHISVSITESIVVSGTVTGGVLQGPGHKRTLRSVFRNGIRKSSKRLRILQGKLWRRANRVKARPTPTTIAYRLYFDDPAWREQSAFEVLEDYLKTLAAIVKAAEDEAQRIRA